MTFGVTLQRCVLEIQRCLLAIQIYTDLEWDPYEHSNDVRLVCNFVNTTDGKGK